NTVHGRRTENRVEVVRLFGPNEATRTNVLREVMLRWYDVLHFAGHCVFDTRDATRSGWIFTGGQRLTAQELSRVDRVPKFVFSNGWEPGVAREVAGGRSAALAPPCGGAFLGRGVANFVCSAWPVDDRGAREFAMHLYAGLLNVPLSGKGPDPP